jgi:hypothetical protein
VVVVVVVAVVVRATYAYLCVSCIMKGHKWHVVGLFEAWTERELPRSPGWRG